MEKVSGSSNDAAQPELRSEKIWLKKEEVKGNTLVPTELPPQYNPDNSGKNKKKKDQNQ